MEGGGLSCGHRQHPQGVRLGRVTFHTALGWLRRFTHTFPSRRLLVPYNCVIDFQAAAYNEETLRLLGELIRAHDSVRPGHEGEVVSASAIADYLSALRAHRSLQAGYDWRIAAGNLRLPKQSRQM